MTRHLEDNIGLAVFGGTSSLIVQSTCDYDLVLKEIGEDRLCVIFIIERTVIE